MHEKLCTQCQGDGYVLVAGPDYYSSSYGYYLPNEHPETCRVCGGSGYMEVWEEEEDFAKKAA